MTKEQFKEVVKIYERLKQLKTDLMSDKLKDHTKKLIQVQELNEEIKELNKKIK